MAMASGRKPKARLHHALLCKPVAVWHTHPIIPMKGRVISVQPIQQHKYNFHAPFFVRPATAF